VHYEAHKSHANHDSLDAVKKNLTMEFAVFNAVGRLLLGFIADPVAKAVPSMSLPVWFLLGVLGNALLYLFFAVANPGTVASKTDLESAPMSLYILMALAATCYGALFCVNTAFLKKVTPPHKAGLILGCSQLILALGQDCWLTVSGRIVKSYPELTVIKEHSVGPDLRKPFFFVAFITSTIALVPAFINYRRFMADQAKKAAEESD